MDEFFADLTELYSARPYVVVDDASKYQPGDKVAILGRFDTEVEASEFITTLPNYLDGNYGLDGPADDV